MLWVLRFKFCKAGISVFLSHPEWFGPYHSDTQSLFRIMRYGGISLISQENMCFNITYLRGGARELMTCHKIEVRGQLVGVLSLHRVGTRDHTQCLASWQSLLSSTEPSTNPNLHAFKN